MVNINLKYIKITLNMKMVAMPIKRNGILIFKKIKIKQYIVYKRPT